MIRILISLVVFLSAGSIADLKNPRLPWRSILDAELEARGRQRVLCKLPPYPARGGYLVVDEPGAKPGDVFQNVSLVQYRSDNDGADIVVRALHCAAGEWSRSVFKYRAEELYFNTSWCPLLCASFKYDDDVKELSPEPTTVSRTVEAKPSENKSCILPPYPARGGYYLQNQPDTVAKPGDVYDKVVKLITYELAENSEIYKVYFLTCAKGVWYKQVTEFEYNLLRFKKKSWCPFLCSPSSTPKWKALSESKTMDTSKSIRKSVNLNRVYMSNASCTLPPYPEEGNYTVVNSPEAKPGDVVDALHLKYSCYSDKKIIGSKSIYCVHGVWSDKLPRCVRCGSITSTPTERTSEENALRKELPWHASVYTKAYTPYEQICSGSIVATNFVVTAAHCFWSQEEKLQPASRFAVAFGKIYRSWNDPRDAVSQKSDVAEIRTSPKFRGSLNNFKDDVALLLLATPVLYDDYVSPVCVDFDVEFDEQQLAAGSFGKIASWNLIDEKEHESSILQVGWLPYVEKGKCVADASPDFRAYITNDKICAGDGGGTGLCARDGGAGLAFHVRHHDATRVNFYLRGIASVIVTNSNVCNLVSVNTFSHILRHETFLKDNFEDALW